MRCCGATPLLAMRICAYYELEQMLGQPQAAIGHLGLALRDSRVVTLPAWQLPAALTVLAPTRVAPWEANTPLELVIDDQHVTLHRRYLDDGDAALAADALPPYDVTLNSIAESDNAANALRLAVRDDPAYFVMPFVDYSNSDGFFRKYRIMFVAGTARATSPSQLVHGTDPPGLYPYKRAGFERIQTGFAAARVIAKSRPDRKRLAAVDFVF